MNHSPIIFDDIRLARKTDPQSSHDAAQESAKFRKTQAQRIIMYVMGTGAISTWSASDIADATGLTIVQVCRRLPELAAQGLIERVQENGADVIIDGFTVWRAKRA
jgi:DNA-binding MarR family transcriptional regulator